MSRYKLDKRIFIAAMVILLCLVSITGATLALFTDSTDGTIGINATSGSVKVDIVDTTEKENSLVGQVLNFQVDGAQEDVLFEPGATYYTQGFRVKNKGEIPIQFILYVSEDNTDATSAEFNDAFEAWITEDPFDPSDAVKLQDYEGTLAPKQSSQVFYLVFRMKESAGNEYQNKTYSGVGVTVCAVQGNGYIDKTDIENANGDIIHNGTN